MRIVAVYFLFALSIGIANAQSNFHSRVSFDTIPYGWAKGVGEVGGKVYTWGSYIRSDSASMWESSKLFFSTFNIYGELEKINPSLSFPIDTSYLTMRTQQLIYRDGYVYLAASKNDVNNNWGAVLYKYNTDSDSLLKVVYDTDTVDGYVSLTMDKIGYMYAVGLTADSGFTVANLLVSKFDSSLAKLWDYSWQSYGRQTYPGRIICASDSIIIATFAVGLNFSFTTHIIKIDNNGQLLSDSIIPELGGGTSQMLDYNADDGTYLVSGAQTGYNPPFFTINRLDSNYNILWTRNYQAYYAGDYIHDIWNGMRDKNGYVIVGTRNNSRWGWVHKLDFNGNKVWEATYKSQPAGTIPPFVYNMYVSGIDTLPNGGYVLSGSTDSAGYQVAFVMTIDSNGCFSNTACEATYFSDIEYFEPAIAVNVYPNPANEQINFTFTNLQLNQCQLQISNSLGQSIYQTHVQGQQSVINTGSWASGIYFWALLNEGQVLRNGKFVKQ